ncbi:hypothetical protein [Bradyrhizobium brasilense]|uniref:Uncharacterized protein n=1 Tax=Bradyrhizobium brasilense TaxID=1419277 RepID=A0ABY8JFG2_9BRAD|nr:hypothetical protein [Bradyrhizobium brasilense]WFU62698.1 hypothetical protein QA636_35500 [Bradyrhizobium brasilense]
MQASINVVPQGTVLNMLGDAGQRVSAMILNVPPDHPLSKPLANFAARMTDYVGVTNVANGQYQVGARNDALRAAVANVGVGKAFVDLASAGQKERRSVAAATATALEVAPATAATAPGRARTVAHWDGADMATKQTMINELPVDGLAALIEAGVDREPGLSPRDAERLRERYMVEQHIARTGLQADHMLAADHTDPLRTGPNVEAARNAARAAVRTLKDRSETISTVSETMRNIVSMIALAGDVHEPQAYKLLTTGAIA